MCCHLSIAARATMFCALLIPLKIIHKNSQTRSMIDMHYSRSLLSLFLCSRDGKVKNVRMIYIYIYIFFFWIYIICL